MGTEPETEQRILQSAERVFHLRGFEGARMQEIADEAGINKALLHYYFRSKEKLFDAVFASALARLVPPMFATLTMKAPLRHRVEAFVEAYFETVRVNPFLPGFVVYELHRNPERVIALIESHRLGVLCELEQQLHEEVRQGGGRQLSAEQFLLNLLSLCAFPFVASSALRTLSGRDEAGYAALLEERRRLIPDWMEALSGLHSTTGEVS